MENETKSNNSMKKSVTYYTLNVKDSSVAKYTNCILGQVETLNTGTSQEKSIRYLRYNSNTKLGLTAEVSKNELEVYYQPTMDEYRIWKYADTNNDAMDILAKYIDDLYNDIIITRETQLSTLECTKHTLLNSIYSSKAWFNK